jgi:uncharacterized protein with GYD domain
MEKETIMALYMYQASFTSEAWAAMMKNPQNRAEQVRPMVEAVGGKLLGYYFAFGEYDIVVIIFGEYDIVVIIEAPDNVSYSALALAVAGSGAAKSSKTTVLMSVEEGIEAMRKASGAGYRPPGS